MVDPNQVPKKTAVVVRRKWHSPEIHAFVDHTEIGASMDLTDFVRALAAEVGNPTMLLSKPALESKLLAAMDSIVLEMKQTTGSVV